MTSGINAKPAFLLEARLDYPDGSSSTIGTDESWKVLAAYRVHRNQCDVFWRPDRTIARPFNLIRAWNRRLADGRISMIPAWASATVVDRSDYHLFAQMAPLEREQAELKPVSITFTNGAWLVDFGRCIDGWPKLTMRANHPGDMVRVEYFQMTGGRKARRLGPIYLSWRHGNLGRGFRTPHFISSAQDHWLCREIESFRRARNVGLLRCGRGRAFPLFERIAQCHLRNVRAFRAAEHSAGHHQRGCQPRAIAVAGRQLEHWQCPALQ